MRITRRHLQVSLAWLWLLDAALQCQPFMFSRGFNRLVLAPARDGQPNFLAEPMHAAAALLSTHPALDNGAFALIQFLIGLALLSRRFTRAALAVSIAWALSVWIVGEGMGGVGTGGTILNGAPGAALLYAAIAVLAWPTQESGSDVRPSRLAVPMWCALWIVGAGLQLTAANNAPTSLSMMLRRAQSGAPTWIAGIDRRLAGLPASGWPVAVVVAVSVVVAAWVLVPGWTRQWSLGIGVFVSLVSWLLFQGLGDLTSGQATDPNTGPLIVLLAVAVVGVHSREVDPQPARSSTRSASRLRSNLTYSDA